MKYPSRGIFKDNQAEAARLLIQSQAPRTPLLPHSLVKQSRPPQIKREENLWPFFTITVDINKSFFPSGTGNIIHSKEKNQLIPTDL